MGKRVFYMLKGIGEEVRTGGRGKNYTNFLLFNLAILYPFSCYLGSVKS